MRSYEIAVIVTLGVGALAAWYLWRHPADAGAGAQARSADEVDTQHAEHKQERRAVDPDGALSESGPDSEEHTCVCGAPASLRCARCRAVFYCSKTCQRAHWREHKAGCCAIGQDALHLGRLFDRATAASKQGRYRDTMATCDEILGAAGRDAQPLLPLHALLMKAHALLSVGSLWDAQQTFDAARLRSQDLLRAMASRPDAFSHAPAAPDDAFRFAFARKSVAALSRFAQDVSRLDALSAQAGAHAGLAYVARRRGDLDGAVAQSRRALEVSQLADDGLEEAAATSALAMASFQRNKREGLGLMRRAARLRFEALRHNATDDGAVLAAVASAVSTMCNLATALNVTGDRQEALSMYMSALLLPTEQLCQRATHLKLLLNFHTICEECGDGRGPRLPLSADDLAALSACLEPDASTACRADPPGAPLQHDPSVRGSAGPPGCAAANVAGSGQAANAAAGASATNGRGGGSNGREDWDDGAGFDGGGGGEGEGDGIVSEAGWVQIVGATAQVMHAEQRAEFSAHLRQLQALGEGSGYESAAWARRRMRALLLEADGRELDTTCGVCLDALPLEVASRPGEEVVVLECFHALHCACFEKWLARDVSASCPLCQSQLACVAPGPN